MGGYSNYFIALLSSLIICFSVSTSDPSKLSLKKLVIKADRGSPAFAAIEDLYNLDDIADEAISNSRDIERIKIKELKPLNLKGVKISLDDDFDKIDKSNFIKVALLGEKIGVKHFSKKFINKPQVEVAKLANFKQSWGASLTPSSNRRVVSFIDQDSTHGSEGAIKEIAGVFNNKNNDGGGDSSSSLETSLASAATESVQNTSVAQPQVLASNTNDGRKKRRASFSQQRFQSRKMIRGQLLLRDGAILPGSDFVFYIERFFDGIVYESGVVDAESGSFEIEVASAKGVILSELRNAEGHVLAYGELNLSEQKNLREINLELYPTEDDFSGRSLSYESYDDFEKPVPQALQVVTGVEGELESDSEGYFNEQIFAPGSSFVASSHSKDFWSTLSIGVNGKPLYPKLYAKKHIKALSQLADPFGEEIEITSLISGRVTQDGIAQDGMTLKLLGAGYHRPLYYQNKIPNPQASLTSTDGRFTFINLIDGDYLVQVFRGERLLSQRWFKVKRGHISAGQIEIGSKLELDVYTSKFPLKSKLNEDVEVAEYGVDLFTPLSPGEQSKIKVKTNPELTVLQTLPTENLLSQMVTLPAKAKLFNLVKVDKFWIESFLASKKSNANRSLAMIIGFSGEEELKKVVLEASNSKTRDSKVYYFDKFGDSVESPVSGGGYLITDVPSGLNTIILSSRDKSQFTSKLVLAENKALSIVQN